MRILSAVPRIAVASGDAIGRRVAVVNSEIECDGAVATFSIGENSSGFVSRLRILSAVPRIGVASGDTISR